jgi:hypothetical protein
MTIEQIRKRVSESPDTGQFLLESPLRHTLTWRASPADPLEIETDLDLPDELRELWLRVDSMRLFEDSTYGQWGLILLSPSPAAHETAEMNREWGTAA